MCPGKGWQARLSVGVLHAFAGPQLELISGCGAGRLALGGRCVPLEGVSERKPYPSDLSDEAWELIRPVITGWKARHPSASGHEGRCVQGIRRTPRAPATAVRRRVRAR
ncbi:hypothetical protein FRAHR75_170002 [Frankia sp. Hr75.2]|nr:hypothetical protein FRAHR75_170002 [Frankia sp. Hr75.2]SQD96900.1 hypothetical protein FMEAI12_3810005 [Parafrankia sp. Ea1.12]